MSLIYFTVGLVAGFFLLAGLLFWIGNKYGDALDLPSRKLKRTECPRCKERDAEEAEYRKTLDLIQPPEADRELLELLGKFVYTMLTDRRVTPHSMVAALLAQVQMVGKMCNNVPAVVAWMRKAADEFESE